MSTWFTSKTSYAAGFFQLAIDGHESTAYLKNVDGGFVRSALIEEPIGPENLRIKHTSVVDIEPFSFEFAMAGAGHVLEWIQASWRKDWGRRNGQITHANFDVDQQFTHEFSEALILETTFPTLDGASKEAAYVKVKVQPEGVVSTKQSGSRIVANASPKHKMWMCSGFRLNLDGLDEVKYVNKIEAFSIKQGVKKFYTGADRLPQVEPTKIEFPNLTCTMALEFADGLLKWYDQYVVKGKADPAAQKTGSIEFLSTDRASTIFRINLFDVGLHHLQVMQSSANSDQIKRVKFELYVGRMDVDTGASGLE